MRHSNFPGKPGGPARDGLGTVVRKLFRDALLTRQSQQITLEKGLTLRVPGDGTKEIVMWRTRNVKPSWDEARVIARAAGWETVDIRQREGDVTRFPFIIVREERKIF
ncbi:MAG: hypothetical protein HC933_00740 [Pleurocapsa sp. SU_196_0]|nr:hypothetical protein [Pleurocapsa sp. SU_196_0]